MRPPTRRSSTTSASSCADTVWLRGHQLEMRAVHTSKAWSTAQSTSKLIWMGSVIVGGVLSHEAKPRPGFTPHLQQVGAHRGHAILLQPVDAARAQRLLLDEPGLLQQAQVSRYGGTADRQLVGELLHGAATAAQQLDDRPAVGIAERVERVARDAREWVPGR